MLIKNSSVHKTRGWHVVWTWATSTSSASLPTIDQLGKSLSLYKPPTQHSARSQSNTHRYIHTQKHIHSYISIIWRRWVPENWSRSRRKKGVWSQRRESWWRPKPSKPLSLCSVPPAMVNRVLSHPVTVTETATASACTPLAPDRSCSWCWRYNLAVMILNGFFPSSVLFCCYKLN